MPRIIRALSALLAVLVLGFAVGACGDDDESAVGVEPTHRGVRRAVRGRATATLIQKDPANEGKTITVGSKNFAEQYILGEIYAQALEAAGFTVKKQLDLGSEQIAFKALKSGRIDAYPEYTGTALTSFYQRQDRRHPARPAGVLRPAREATSRRTASRRCRRRRSRTPSWSPPRKETAEKLGNPKTLSELAEKAGDEVSISGFPECRQRTDCLLGLNDKLRLGAEVRVLARASTTTSTRARSDLTFGLRHRRPARDRTSTPPTRTTSQLFPPYYITLLVREEGVEKLGEAGQDVIEKIQEPLTEEVMQELNSRVTIDKEKPEDVAADYLQEPASSSSQSSSSWSAARPRARATAGRGRQRRSASRRRG